MNLNNETQYTNDDRDQLFDQIDKIIASQKKGQKPVTHYPLKRIVTCFAVLQILTILFSICWGEYRLIQHTLVRDAHSVVNFND